MSKPTPNITTRLSDDLYNSLNYEYLIECAKSGNISDWNQKYQQYLHLEWIRLFPQIPFDPNNVEALCRYNSGLKRPNFVGKDFTSTIQAGIKFSSENPIVETDDFQWELQINGENIQGFHLEGADFRDAKMEGIIFKGAYLYGARFGRAILRGSCFQKSKLSGARFGKADLTGVHFESAELIGVNFWNANLANSNFYKSKLQGSYLKFANLTNCQLRYAHLEKVNFEGANICSADFSYSVVDGETLIINNVVDNTTNFTGVGLSSARISPQQRVHFERNIRKFEWNLWYQKDKISSHISYNNEINENSGIFKKIEGYSIKTLIIPLIILNIICNTIIKSFMFLTDYGRVTYRVVIGFFIWNFLWAWIYYSLTTYSPWVFSNTDGFFAENPQDFIHVWSQSNLVALYPDILGSSTDYIWTFCVSLHILGCYILLAAFITRFEDLFKSISP